MPTDAPRSLLLDRTLITCFTMSFLLFGGVYVLHTLLPAEVLRLHGTRFEAGLLFTVATALSMVLRPLVGHWIDRWGPRRVMVPGIAIYVATSLGLQLATRPAHLIALMGGIGVATGLVATALVVIVTSCTPADRRGETLSLFYLAQSVATALAPACGFAVAARVGVGGDYALVTVAGVLIAGLTISTPRATVIGVPAPRAHARFFTRHAVVPGVVLVLTNVGYGSVYALLPLHAREAGWTNIGWFFTLSSAWLIVSRLLLRTASDRYGRVPVLVPAIVAIALAHFSFAAVPTPVTLVAGAILLGTGVSVLYPTLLAFVVDRTPPAERGLAIGTLSASFDLGMALGSASLGALAHALSYGVGFLVAGLTAVSAAALLTVTEAQRRRETPREAAPDDAPTAGASTGPG